MSESGDGVGLPLTLSLTVGVVGLTLRGGPLIRSIITNNFFFFFNAKKFVQQTVR